MDEFHAFGYFWLGMVTLIIGVNVAWALNDLKVGSARMGWMSARVRRDEEPFEFWLAVGGKLVGALLVGPFFIWHGLQMFGT